ncbi:phospholipase/carboxylesterase family protein [Nemania sp. FL0031]|nr:phospholipase/carboxylesterase family protein [Nemania sp. FL0031]
MVLCNVALPAYARHTHTVIFLHGRATEAASSARELSDEVLGSKDYLGRSLQHIFPSVKWVFPQADEVHIELSDGQQKVERQWFDIQDPRDPDRRRELQIPGLKHSVSELIALIRGEAANVGLENVILAGMSQGSTTAIHTLLNYPKSEAAEEGNRLCGLIALSGWMSLGGSSVQETRGFLGLDTEGPPASDEVFRNTPVFISHSTDNPVVPFSEGKIMRDTLMAYGMQVEWREYYNDRHGIAAPQGVHDIVAFLVGQGLQSV